MTSFAMLGFMELLILLGGGASPGFGLPPGERDTMLVKVAPADAVAYIEWVARAEGKPGAPGVDGIVADPEIVEFVTKLKTEILAMTKRESSGNREAEIAGENIPALLVGLWDKPGCAVVTFDQELAARAMEELGGQMGPQSAALGLQVTLIFNAGEDADALEKNIIALMQLMPAAQNSKERHLIPLPIQMANGPELEFARHKDYLLLCFGKDGVKNAIAALDGDGEGIAANERFQAQYKQVAFERNGTVTWLDLKAVTANVAKMLGPQGEQMVPAMLKMVGADGLESVISVTGVTPEGQIANRTLIHTGGKTEGILSLAAGRALTVKDFEQIPGDADLVQTFSINLPKVLEAARAIINAADPNAGQVFEEDLEQIEDELGITTDDLFAAIGDVWTIYDSPSAGGLFVTSVVGAIEVKDKAAAEKLLKKALEILSGQLPGELPPDYRQRRGVFLESREFMDHTIHFINTIGDEMPFAPAICLTDRHLLIAPHPQAIKAHLRMMSNTKGSLAAKLEKQLSGKQESIMLGYMESTALVRYFYAIVPYFGQVGLSQAQANGLKLDVFSIPSAQAILPYMSNGWSSVSRTKEGILLEGQQAIPLPGGSSVMTSFPGMIFGFAMTTMRAVEMPAQPQLVPAQPVPIRGNIRIQAIPAEAVPEKAVPLKPVPEKAVKPVPAKPVPKKDPAEDPNRKVPQRNAVP